MFQKPEKKDHNSTSSLKKQGPTTHLKIIYNVGYPNNLFIRGQGAGLSWEKGIALKNINENEWIWETNEIFPVCHFKLLINDVHFENGDNHEIRCGSTMEYAPTF